MVNHLPLSNRHFVAFLLHNNHFIQQKEYLALISASATAQSIRGWLVLSLVQLYAALTCGSWDHREDEAREVISGKEDRGR